MTIDKLERIIIEGLGMVAWNSIQATIAVFDDWICFELYGTLIKWDGSIFVAVNTNRRYSTIQELADRILPF